MLLWSQTKDRDEADENKTKESGNYSFQPRPCPFVHDNQSVIRNYNPGQLVKGQPT